MHITPAGLSLIKNQESLRLTAYTCPAGILTIGYGHTGADVYVGETITEAEAVLILNRDIARFEVCVSEMCPETTAAQFSAMVSLAFNIGEQAFRESSVARLHNAGFHNEAGQAFALWNKAGGKVLPGLVRRRAGEAALYLEQSGNLESPAATAEGERPLSRSRAINGQAVALAGTTGTIGISQFHADEVLGDWSQTLLQMLPYASEIKWLLLIMILFGIAYAVYARVHDRHMGRA